MQSVSREESRHKHNKNPSTACTNSRGAGCENKHMDAVQRNKLNIHSVGTEMKSLAANMPNHRVQFTLLRPVWNVKYEGGPCSLQRCCWFLTASRGLVVSAQTAGLVSASARSAWEYELFEADFQALCIQSFVM